MPDLWTASGPEKVCTDTFFELVNKLGKWFSITRAALIIHDDPTASLQLISWWDTYSLREGVLMTLPNENSLLHKTLRSRTMKQADMTRGFRGNQIERRLLVSIDTASLMIYPLEYESTIHGLLSLASPVDGAFDLLEQGYLGVVFSRLGNILAEQRAGDFTTPLSDIYHRNGPLSL